MATAILHGSHQVGQSEDALLRKAIERVYQQFPEVDSDTLIRMVHGRYDELNDASVRELVAARAERSRREQLEHSCAVPLT